MDESMRKRERWQARAAGVGGFVVLTILGVPGAMVVLSPALVHTESEDWRTIGPLETFPVGETVLVDVGGGVAGELGRRVYLRRDGNGNIAVISRACTDLSCPVEWDPGSACFYCPCHGGIFDQEGRPMAGPPSRPLYRFAVRVREGAVEIDLRSVPPTG
jgi:menaquinol-cytochrome c reductase iron-sulfur subunit